MLRQFHSKYVFKLLFRQVPRFLATTSTNDVERQIDDYLNSAWEAHLQSDFSASAKAFQKAVVLQSSELGPNHENTLLSKNNLGAALLNQGQLDEAEPILRETLHERISTLGDDHEATLTTANNLSMLLKQRGELEEAEVIAKRAFVGSLTSLGPANKDVLDTAQNYGEILAMVGKLDKCESLMQQMLDQCTRNFGHKHPNTLQFVQNLAIIQKLKEEQKEE